MIVRLKGQLLEKHPDNVVMDLQGVGYRVWITVNTYEALPVEGSEAVLLIYHKIREDAQDLFGFIDEAEREVFQQLISVKGISPKLGITMLSGALPDDLRNRVQAGDEGALTAIKGIGPKMARRIITELSDKFAAGSARGGETWVGTSKSVGPLEEAARSLITLGYSRQEAQRALSKAVDIVGKDAPIEKIIRAALSGK
jgi:Holliday junction DNA helicase RuvA